MKKILRFVTRTKTGKALLVGTLLATGSGFAGCGSSDGGKKGGGGGESRSFEWGCSVNENYPFSFDVDVKAPGLLPKKLDPYVLSASNRPAYSYAYVDDGGEERGVIYLISKEGDANEVYWLHPKGAGGIEGEMDYNGFRDSDPGELTNRMASCN